MNCMYDKFLQRNLHFIASKLSLATSDCSSCRKFTKCSGYTMAIDIIFSSHYLIHLCSQVASQIVYTQTSYVTINRNFKSTEHVHFCLNTQLASQLLYSYSLFDVFDQLYTYCLFCITGTRSMRFIIMLINWLKIFFAQDDITI